MDPQQANQNYSEEIGNDSFVSLYPYSDKVWQELNQYDYQWEKVLDSVAAEQLRTDSAK